jgi:hypothetical protein
VNSFDIFGIDDAPIFWLRISSLLSCQSVSICVYEVLYHCKLRLQNLRAMELFHHQATFDPALRGPHLCEGGGDDPDPGVAESTAWMVRMVHHDEQSLYHSNQGCCNLIFWNMMATGQTGWKLVMLTCVNNGASVWWQQPRQAKGSLPHWTGELEELQELVIQEQKWLEMAGKRHVDSIDCQKK